MKQTLHIAHDDNAIHIVEKLNGMLEPWKLKLTDDGKVHDGYLFYELSFADDALTPKRRMILETIIATKCTQEQLVKLAEAYETEGLKEAGELLRMWARQAPTTSLETGGTCPTCGLYKEPEVSE